LTYIKFKKLDIIVLQLKVEMVIAYAYIWGGGGIVLGPAARGRQVYSRVQTMAGTEGLRQLFVRAELKFEEKYCSLEAKSVMCLIRYTIL
jgi:hypothetical protein